MEAAFVAAMRVPGLLIVDHWWFQNPSDIELFIDLGENLNAIGRHLFLLYGFLILLLPLHQVKVLHSHFVSIQLIRLGFYLCGRRVESAIKNSNYIGHAFDLVLVLVFQFGINKVISFLIKVKCLLPFSFYALPIIIHHVYGGSSDIFLFLYCACNSALVLYVFFYIKQKLPQILDCAQLTYVQVLSFTEVYRIETFLTRLWNRLFIPQHFAIVWLISFSMQLVEDIYFHKKLNVKWYFVLLSTLCNVCNSPVALVATSVMITYFSFLTLRLTRAYLQGPAAFFQDNPLNSGFTEGLSLIIMSLQAGLIEIQMPGRMAVMTIILFIIISTLLQSMLEVTEPVVFALSASRSRSVWRHFRALSMCFLLLMLPLYFSYQLSVFYPMDFWMTIVLSSCTLTSVRVLDLLIVHALFVYDGAAAEPWANLDDIAYYTRAVAKMLEFVIAVFVVSKGLWENVNTKFSMINLLILIFHSYVNIWQRWQTGWHSFRLRREASKKTESLPSATNEQLDRLNDVCSICFDSMKTACVTPCQHFFHRACLRKWVSVQDKCPLCHRRICLMSANHITDSTVHNNQQG